MKNILVLCNLIIIIFIFNGCNNNYGMTDNEFSEMKSKEIVRCFDEKDIETLKLMFCEKTETEFNLDGEIQIAFDLYQGISTSYDFYFGGTAGGWKYGEWFDKNITPQIRNIKTDKDKIYKISWFEYLAFDEDENMIGIVRMSLRDSNGNILAKIGWDE